MFVLKLHLRVDIMELSAKTSKSGSDLLINKIKFYYPRNDTPHCKWLNRKKIRIKGKQ